ncbi:hypothetical protein [Novosphingobium sp. Gsoil 351]|uniref:hypothetical protein n=1 Tax=Novosphingobium sp. Gsoil 351 TaxID=2675225 RepID=UPI0012B4C302|nr:hypothetical protein [Novosphingobium sp. Gsoil 351]QGN55472.1 hypothetical protein GKE62_13855 [Novosphingobium sp. Gsoil 351]
MDNHGVLVGWTHQELGQKLVLNLQTIKQVGTPDDIDRTTIMLTKNQAAVLGNYLFQIAGQTPPIPGERCWLRRVLG